MECRAVHSTAGRFVMNSPEEENSVANKALQESYPQIIDLLRPDEVIAILYSRSRLTTQDLEELNNCNKGDRQKSAQLYLKALADKGLSALNDFLDALNETADYQPHAELWDKLRSKTQELRQKLFANSSSSTSRDNDQDEPPGIAPVCFESLNRGSTLVPGLTLSLSEHAHYDDAKRPDDSFETDGSKPPDHDDHTLVLASVTSHPLSRSAANDERKSSAPKQSKEMKSPLVVTNQTFTETDGASDEVTRDNYSSECCIYNNTKEKLDVVRSHESKISIESGFYGDEFDAPVLKQMSNPLPNMINLKLILLGSSKVGKTSLIQRFSQNKFSETLPETIGNEHVTRYCRHNHKKVNIKLGLYDTAGKESPLWITPNYFKDVKVALIVFDATDQQKTSLHDVNNWVDQLLLHCDKDIPIILVGNKCDNGVIADNRRYAKHLVKTLNLHSYMETSAKSGDHVEEVFESAISLGVDRCDLVTSGGSKASTSKDDTEVPVTHTDSDTRYCCIIL